MTVYHSLELLRWNTLTHGVCRDLSPDCTRLFLRSSGEGGVNIFPLVLIILSYSDLLTVSFTSIFFFCKLITLHCRFHGNCLSVFRWIICFSTITSNKRRCRNIMTLQRHKLSVERWIWPYVVPLGHKVEYQRNARLFIFPKNPMLGQYLWSNLWRTTKINV